MRDLRLATSVLGRPGHSVLIAVILYILYFYANTTFEPTRDKQQHSYETTPSEINNSQYLCSATLSKGEHAAKSFDGPNDLPEASLIY